MASSKLRNGALRASTPVGTGHRLRSSDPGRSGLVDVWIVAVAVGLVIFGVVMVYSASAVYADRTFHDGQYFLRRQLVFAVLSMVAMAVAATVPLSWWRRGTYAIFAVAVLLMVALPMVGREVGGATRWISLGPVNIQPAELLKLALVLWLAHSLAKKTDQVRSFAIGFLPHALVAGVLMVLCLAQPDFGSAMIVALLTFVLLFASGAKTGYLLGAVLLLAPVAYFLVRISPYRMRRIRAFLDPFAHRYDVGYQISESLMSYGSGGLTGEGLGDSRLKLFYLPEAHTDFIGAVVGAELGFLGVCFMVALFGLLTWRGFVVSLHAPGDYPRFLALGVTMIVTLQAAINLAVSLGLVPTKGLVLPFVSYGGSSLLVCSTAVGLLLNVSRQVTGAEAGTTSRGVARRSVLSRERMGAPVGGASV